MSKKSSGESVRVCVRIRPLFGKEKQEGRECIVFADAKHGTINIKDPKSADGEKNFTFDAAFPDSCSQMDIYTGAASGIVDAVLDGFNGTIFAYGQTGAGKSHTMEGDTSSAELRGIIPNSFQHVFDKVTVSSDKKFLVRASYLEIYNEEVRDLLAKDTKNSLELKENVETGVFVKNLTFIAVTDVNEMEHVMQMGKKNRSVGATLMNQTSSRSHSMFQIVVECYGEGQDGEGHVCVGKLNLVDLAGSERQSKTGATGDRLKEATKINLSLSALGNVIKALVDGSSRHIPYRDSKLTRLLQDSLGGNAKTVMIANCGPADYNFDETISTLRYANRAKNIKNKPKINEDPKDAMLREYQEEIDRLKMALAAQGKSGTQTVDGKQVPMQAAEKEIVERVVEKIVIKREGLSEAELQEIEANAMKEKEDIKKKAKAEMKALMAKQSQTEEERMALEKQLIQKAEEKAKMEQDKTLMLETLANLEEKLVVGGKIKDKAAQQEIELREAKLKLEEQHRQEMLLARELAERDDSNMMLEEQYTSLQDEVDIKTKKLKKLWSKHKTATTDLVDLKDEFRQERDDMLETIRGMQQQLKLKQAIRSNFVPPAIYDALQQRAQWSDEDSDWKLGLLKVDPANIKPTRKVSIPGLRRPETKYSRHRKQFDNNARYKIENIITLDLDRTERTTLDFDDSVVEDTIQIKLLKDLENEPEEILYDAEVETRKRVTKGEQKESNSSQDESKSTRARRSNGRPGTASRQRA